MSDNTNLDGQELFNQGLQHEQANNLDKAFLCYKQAAEQGYVFAMYNLALCYKDGKGCTPSSEKSFSWMQKSAHKNFHEAQLCVAVILINKPQSTLKEREQAFLYLTLAAQQNNPTAVRLLAEFFQKGIVVEKDLSKAFDLYKVAAGLGEVLAQHNLACMYQIGDGVARNIQLACDWFEKAIIQGHQPSLQSLRDLDKNNLNKEAKITLARLKFRKII